MSEDERIEWMVDFCHLFKGGALEAHFWTHYRMGLAQFKCEIRFSADPIFGPIYPNDTFWSLLWACPLNTEDTGHVQKRKMAKCSSKRGAKMTLSFYGG